MCSLVLVVCGLLGLAPGHSARANDQGSNASLALGPSDVLILINEDSPVSRAIGDLYRQYYPDIEDDQVLELSGLPDCASPQAGSQDEIITRDQFESLIAQPLRDHLIAEGMVNSIYCFITTAGMPYRIEDTDPTYHKAVCAVGEPGCLKGTLPGLVLDYRGEIDAATVEAELSVLFQIDPALPDGVRMYLDNRLVNPYQAYSSPIKSWSAERDILARRDTFSWTWLWRFSQGPMMEGTFSAGFVAANRTMSPADIYLVSRLDGPRQMGETPLAAVKAMLDRSMAAGNPDSPLFTGISSQTSSLVIDDTGGAAADEFAYSQVLNFPPVPSAGYSYTMTYEDFPVPPGTEVAEQGFTEGQHYEQAWSWLVGEDPIQDGAGSSPSTTGLQPFMHWDDTTAISSQAALNAGQVLSGLLTYGRNAGDGRPHDYLLSSGPDGEELFECAAGAVFASMESFNAISMFTDIAPKSQALLSEFIAMGGSGAIGHAFEPERLATIQGDYLFRNLMRDDDQDGRGDLSFVEAGYSAMPFLSWSEVMIGDPLMRLEQGPGGPAPEISDAPELIMAASRLMHGSKVHDIPIFLQGADTGRIDPRKGGGSQIVLWFSEPVDAGGDEVVCGEHITPYGATCNGEIEGSGTLQLTVELDVEPNACICLVLSGLTAVADGEPVEAPYVCTSVLQGDVSGDGSVTMVDLSVAKAGIYFPEYYDLSKDVNVDGAVTLLDLSCIKAFLTEQLACNVP